MLLSSIDLQLDPTLDQFGFQPVTFQSVTSGLPGAQEQVAFSIFDTGASVVSLSAFDQFVFDLGGNAVPIKVPGGAEAEGIGGVLTGDVSEPVTVKVDGLHVSQFHMDPQGFPIFEINFTEDSAQMPGVQLFVGTMDGSENLPTISGTPMLNPSPANPDGLAVRMSPEGYLLDFSDLAPGLVLPVPDVRFQQPGIPLTSSETISVSSTVADTNPAPGEFRGALELFDIDDFYVGYSLRFSDGPLAGEYHKIVDFVGATRKFVFDQPFSAAPINGEAFDIVRFSTEPFTVSLDFVGFDNHLDPGDLMTVSRNPVQSHVSLMHNGVTIPEQKFLFDTGAMLSTITVQEAVDLGLDLSSPDATITIGGAGGLAENIPGFTIDALAIPTTDGGAITFHNVPVFVIDVATEIQGILGMNLFNVASTFVYDPFHPAGSQLEVTFFTDRVAQTAPLNDPAAQAILQLLPFAGALGVNGIQLPSFEVPPNNSPPVADPGGPYVVERGSNLQLDGSGSSDPDISLGDSVVDYAWDLDNDGQFDDATGAAPIIPWAALQLLGLSEGTHTVGLQVTDTFGATATATTTLDVVAPTGAVDIAAIPDQTTTSGVPLAVPLTVRAPAGSTLSFHTGFVPPAAQAADLDWQLDLSYRGNYYENWGGWGEKWIYSNAQRAWYFLTPDGRLYRWNEAGGRDLSTSQPVATLDATFHADPSLLHTASDPTSNEAIAFDLDQRLGLWSTGNYYENWGGWGEKWIRSAANGSWYFITPAGDVYRWAGGRDLSASQRVATLDSSYHADPALLHEAPDPSSSWAVGRIAYELDQQLGLYATGNYYQNWGGWQEKWVRGAAEARWYFITPDGSVYQWAGGRDLSASVRLAVLDPTVYANPAKLHDALDPRPKDEVAYELDQQLGLEFTGNYYENWGGAGEKWLRAANGQWYFITPAGDLFRWGGRADLSASQQVAQLGGAYHADPAALYNASPPTGPGGSTVVYSSASGSDQLIVTPGAGFSGMLDVYVFATGLAGGDWESFTVRVDPPGAGGAPLLAAGPASDANGSAHQLAQGAIATLAQQAVDLWAELGLSAAQLAQLNNVQLQVADLPGQRLGQAAGLNITLDIDAAGHGWFVDQTPEDNDEFSLLGQDGLMAAADSAAAGNMDLLTVLLHEMGHVLGLADDYSPGSGDLMSGWLAEGIRRLPGEAELTLLLVAP